MKKILIPTDFSECASKALLFCLDQFKDSDISIYFVHVINPLVQESETYLPNEYIKSLAKEAETQLNFVSACIMNSRSNSKITNIERFIKLGPIPKLIQETAKNKNVDAIVMGTRGKSHDFIDKLLGSVSIYMIQKPTCPVILVPNEYQRNMVDKLVFATDLQTGTPKILDKILWLFPSLDSINFVHTSSKNNSEILKEKFSPFKNYMLNKIPLPNTKFVLLEGENIVPAIQKYFLENHANLLVMPKTNKGLLQSVFKPNYTRKMLNRLQVPLMVVN